MERTAPDERPDMGEADDTPAAVPLKLLLVEDDADVREVVQVALGLDPALDVRVAAGGAEALAVLAGAGWQPECVLLDMRMAEPAGEAVLASIRRSPRLAGLPVILLTANVRPRDIAQYRTLGARGVIAKPFDPLGLARDVRRILAAGVEHFSAAT